MHIVSLARSSLKRGSGDTELCRVAEISWRDKRQCHQTLSSGEKCPLSEVSLYIHTVMEDVVTIMFSEQWLEELFRPQTTFSVDGLKVLFMKVAHSSIMRLNNIAMEKVYTCT